MLVIFFFISKAIEGQWQWITIYSVYMFVTILLYMYFFLLRFRNVSTGPMFLESYVFQMYLFYTSLLSVSFFLYTSKLYLTYEGKPVKFTKKSACCG